MKEFVKSIFFAVVKLIETIISCFSILLFSSFYVNRYFNKYKKENKTNECIIFANGASLKKLLTEEIESFARKKIFTVNLFYETDYFFKIKPTGHIIADEGFWQPTLNDRILGIQSRFKYFLLKVDWHLDLFIPTEGVKILTDILKQNGNINIVPYNRVPVSGYRKLVHFLYKRNLGMPKPANVANAAIFLGLNLGYKKILLYGVDHSWISDLFVDEDGDISCYENHFYDDTVKALKVPKGSLASGLKGFVDALESYEMLKIYSKTLDAGIINKTRGSFIDVFDRN